MALPASWTKVPVTAKYLAFDGTPIKGSVVFTPTRVVSVADSVVVPSAISVSIDAEGRIATDLPATNDPDLRTSGWVYQVQEKFPGGRKYNIEVPHDGGAIDLGTVAPLVPVEMLASTKGPPGESAYKLAVRLEQFSGTEAEWLASLQGGAGESAYEAAVAGGFVGTKEQWLASLQGGSGKSAYQSAVDTGFAGSEAEWIASLKGSNGSSATVEVGSVTSGLQASVTNSGTPSAAVLDFTLPKGDKGADGDSATVSVGTVTTVDAAEDAAVTQGGTPLNRTINFFIPRGTKGYNGAGAGLPVLDFVQAGDNGDISLAINRAKLAGVPLALPHGTFDLQSPIDYGENLMLRGPAYPMLESQSGKPASAIINAPNGFLKNPVAVPGPGDRDRIFLCGLEVIGGGTGIGISGPFGGRIENCHFRNFATIIENRESYLLRIVRSSFENADQGIMLAGSNQVRIEDCFFAADCKLALDNYTLTDLSGVGQFGSPIIVRGNNFNLHNLDGPHTAIRLSGMLEFVSNYIEDFGADTGNTCIEWIVQRFGGFGSIVANNEFNGPSGTTTPARAIYINGTSTLANSAAGVITRNRFIGFGGGEIVFGPNNRIENLSIVDNGSTPDNPEPVIVNKRSTIAYRPISHGRTASPVNVSAGTFTTLPVNASVVYDNCDGLGSGPFIRARKVGVCEYEGVVTLHAGGSAISADVHLEMNGSTILDVVSNVSVAAGESKQVVLKWTGQVALNDDVRLEVDSNGTAEGQLCARWISNTDGWQ